MTFDPAPRLSVSEWREVKAAVRAVADCGCDESAGGTSLLARFGRKLSKRSKRPVPAELRPVQDLLCESGRKRSASPRHIQALSAQGFNPAQIEAIALIGA